MKIIFKQELIPPDKCYICETRGTWNDNTWMYKSTRWGKMVKTCSNKCRDKINVEILLWNTKPKKLKFKKLII